MSGGTGPAVSPRNQSKYIQAAINGFGGIGTGIPVLTATLQSGRSENKEWALPFVACRSKPGGGALTCVGSCLPTGKIG